MHAAIIGAGLAGLTAARDLVSAGHQVTVFEKARGAGGRTSTRRGDGGLQFDHGAPALHDGDDPAQGLPATATVEHTLAGGGRWNVTVGAPTMSAVAKALADGLHVRLSARVMAIDATGGGWTLTLDGPGDPEGPFDAVLVTAPAPQAAELLRDAAPELAAAAGGATFNPCWAVMAAWDRPLPAAHNATAVRNHGPLSLAVDQSALPGRAAGSGAHWVLQGSAEWSAAQLEATPELVQGALLGAFAEALGAAGPLAAPSQLSAHRWRYARARRPLSVPYLRAGSLLAAGDWCGGADAAAAVASGRAAAAAIA